MPARVALGVLHGRKYAADLSQDCCPIELKTGYRQAVLSAIVSHPSSLRVELAAGLPPVYGDCIQLQQVLFNLIINGIEAMADTGDSSREIVVQALAEKSDAVTISVRDSGIGIDEKQGDLLFDAFYTTKPEGMGIGLSISRSIVEDPWWSAVGNRKSAPGAQNDLFLYRADIRRG